MDEKIKPKRMKALRWPTNKQQADYMNKRQAQNKQRSVNNANENWLAEKLKVTGHKWTRQVRWGYRIFDFWCHELGIAVESDGSEHDKKYDAYRDEYNYRRSGILVLRVRNKNLDDTNKAIEIINKSCTWTERRGNLGIVKGSKRYLVIDQEDMFK